MHITYKNCKKIGTLLPLLLFTPTLLADRPTGETNKAKVVLQVRESKSIERNTSYINQKEEKKETALPAKENEGKTEKKNSLPEKNEEKTEKTDVLSKKEVKKEVLPSKTDEKITEQPKDTPESSSSPSTTPEENEPSLHEASSQKEQDKKGILPPTSQKTEKTTSIPEKNEKKDKKTTFVPKKEVKNTVPAQKIKKKTEVKRSSVPKKKTQKTSRKQKSLFKQRMKKAISSQKKRKKATTAPKKSKKTEKTEKKKAQTKDKAKKKSTATQKEEKKPEKVNEEELLIKTRIANYTKNEQWTTQGFFRILTHPNFFKIIDKQLGGLSKSLKASKPLLDKHSISDLRLDEGPLSNRSYNLINRVAQQAGFTSPIGKFGFVANMLSLNKDKKRVLNNRKLVEAFKNHPKEACLVRDSIKESNEAIASLVMFLARDFYPAPVIQGVDQLVDIKRDPVMWWMVRSGLMKEETLEKSNPGVGMHKFTKINIGLIENFSEAEKHFDAVKKITNTLWLIVNKVSLGYLAPDLGPEDHTLFSLREKANERLPYRFVNFFARRINAFIGLFHRRGKWYHVFTGGPDVGRNNLFTNDIGIYQEPQYKAAWWFKWVLSPFSFLYHGVIQLSRSLLRLFELFSSTYNMLLHWQKVTVALQQFLKNILNVYDAIIKVEEAIEANPELRTMLRGPILKALMRVKNSKELHKIMEDIRKLSTKKPTLWQVFSPMSPVSVVAFTTYKRLEGISKEAEQVLREGTLAFSLLDVYQALGIYVYMSEKDLVKGKMCLADIKEQKEPSFIFKKAYTPMLDVNTAVTHDSYIGKINATTQSKNTRIFTGMNGSGKSICGDTTFHNICFIHGYGVAFSEKAEATLIDRLFFLNGVTGDITRKKSKFMQEIEVISNIVSYIDDPKHKVQIIMIWMDEFFNGTIEKEGTPIYYEFLKYLNRPNIITHIATHNLELFKMAEKEGYDKMEYFTTEYDEKKKQFRYTPKKGVIDKPVSVHVLKDMGFPSQILDPAIVHMKKDKTYPFRHMLPGEPILEESDSDTGSHWAAIALFIVLVLALAGGAGYYVFIIRRKRKK